MMATVKKRKKKAPCPYTDKQKKKVVTGPNQVKVREGAKAEQLN